MQTRRFIAEVACAAGIAGGWSVQISAGAELGLDFANGIDRTPLEDSNYGWSFSLAAPIIIDGLGFWDAGSDGLVESHPVGLWRTSGPIGVPVLITSTTVSNGSLPVSSMSATGRWLFSSVPAVTLDAGSYIVGALYNGGPQKPHDPFVSDALTIVTVQGVQYGSTREVHNTPTLTCPTDFGLNEHNGFFGPNFRVVVPEPSISAVLAAAGLLLSARRRS